MTRERQPGDAWLVVRVWSRAFPGEVFLMRKRLEEVAPRAPAPAKRTRGRPPREPDLLPFGVPYEGAWRTMFIGFMRHVRGILADQEDESNRYERRLARYHAARDDGEAVELPAPPPTLYQALRGIVPLLPDTERAWLVENRWRQWKPFPWVRTLIDLRGRAHVLRPTNQMIGEWFLGEAIARGFICDFKTAHEMWTAQAELVLSDADIGKITADWRSPRIDPEDAKVANRDLARRVRKRVRDRQKAFGYRSA